MKRKEKTPTQDGITLKTKHKSRGIIEIDINCFAYSNHD